MNFDKIFAKHRTAVKGLVDQVEQARLDRLRAKEVRDAAVAAPVPDAEIEARVDKYLAEQERWARSNGYGGGKPFTTPKERKADYVDPPSTKGPFANNPVGMLCALGFKDVIRAQLISEAKASSAGNGLSDDERQRSIAAADADIRSAEILEEGLIRLCEESGIEMHRRADADPAVWLAADLAKVEG